MVRRQIVFPALFSFFCFVFAVLQWGVLENSEQSCGTGQLSQLSTFHNAADGQDAKVCYFKVPYFTGGKTEAVRSQYLKSGLLEPSSSEYNPWTNSTSTLGELARNADSKAPLWTYRSRLGIGTRSPLDLGVLYTFKVLLGWYAFH